MSLIRTLLIAIIFFAFHLETFAQNVPSYRWEQGVSIKNKLTTQWTASMQLKGRFQSNSYTESPWSNVKVNMIDARGYLSYSFLNQSSVQIGYIIRMNNPFEDASLFERRLTQKYSFFDNFGKHRLSQSISMEERIIDKQFVGRLRYKIGDDFPLQGYSLDKGELFLLTYTEMLFSFNAFSKELENRFSIGIGKLFSSGGKFVMDIETRYSDLIDRSNQLILQLNTVYYIN